MSGTKSKFSIWKKPTRIAKKMCQDKSIFYVLECDALESSTRRKETRSLLCSRLAWMRGWNQNCCLCVVTRLRLFYSGHYCLICGDFLKSLGVWSIYMPLRVRYNQARFDHSAVLRKNFGKMPCSAKKSESPKQMQYDASTTDRHESDQLSKKITSTKLTKNSMPKCMNVLRLQ